ncbi:MAG TPA: cytochrome c [Longimicrobiales bacterium]|nr:cytochrome c [Longimicrobiales bacterium]
MPPTARDGQQVYNDYCMTCHHPDGNGSEGIVPPLAGSEWVTGDSGRLIRILLKGLTGTVMVMGTPYDGLMPPFGEILDDAQLAAVATYVRSAWDNDASEVTPAEVAAVRAAVADRTAPWTVRELNAAMAQAAAE